MRILHQLASGGLRAKEQALAGTSKPAECVDVPGKVRGAAKAAIRASIAAPLPEKNA